MAIDFVENESDAYPVGVPVSGRVPWREAIAMVLFAALLLLAVR
jgi:hypothetical protein